MNTATTTHSELRAAALDAARAGNRDEVLRLLARMKLEERESAALDDLWLLGEQNYLLGRYVTAREQSAQFDTDSRAMSAPPWQRFRSLHRQAFCAIQLNDPVSAIALLDRADELLGHNPILRPHNADLLAMRGHVLELRGDFKAALLVYVRAHREARKCENWRRSATIASDIGRVYSIRKEPQKALRWLDRASADIAKAPNTLIERTILLRRGMVFAMLDLPADARAAIDAVIAQAKDGTTPEVAVDARARKADLLRRERHWERAEKMLIEGGEIAREAGLRRHQIYIYKDLAALHLAWDPAKIGAAATAFGVAVDLAVADRPPAALILSQLAEDILVDPRVVGAEHLPRSVHQQLREATRILEQRMSTSAYQLGTQKVDADRAIEHLAALLARVVGRRIILATCRVHVRVMRVEHADGSESDIDDAELQLLEYLVKRSEPVKIEDVVKALGLSIDAANKRMQRLRHCIQDNLVRHRNGNARLYSVRQGTST